MPALVHEDSEPCGHGGASSASDCVALQGQAGQGNGAEVILTLKKVRHAREYPCTALFVVSNITVGRAEDGTVTATGGNHRCYDPWRVGDGTLTPLGFRHQVPLTQAEDA